MRTCRAGTAARMLERDNGRPRENAQGMFDADTPLERVIVTTQGPVPPRALRLDLVGRNSTLSRGKGGLQVREMGLSREVDCAPSGSPTLFRGLGRLLALSE